MADFIAYYDSLVGCLNLESGLKFWTEAQDCPIAMWGPKCGLVLTWIWTFLGLYLILFYARVVYVCLACDGCMCGLLCGHLLLHNWS